MDEIWCARCRQHLSKDAFTPSQAKRKDAWCRPCYNAYRRAVRAGETTVNRRDSAECRGCGADLTDRPRNVIWCGEPCRMKAFLAARPNFYSERWLDKAYGITPEVKEQMLAEQGGRCPICGTQSSAVWHVDHCHTTGRVRGVLCSPCNLGLGHFRDNVDALAAAITYLEGGRVGAQEGS